MADCALCGHDGFAWHRRNFDTTGGPGSRCAHTYGLAGVDGTVRVYECPCAGFTTMEELGNKVVADAKARQFQAWQDASDAFSNGAQGAKGADGPGCPPGHPGDAGPRGPMGPAGPQGDPGGNE